MAIYSVLRATSYVLTPVQNYRRNLQDKYITLMDRSSLIYFATDHKIQDVCLNEPHLIMIRQRPSRNINQVVITGVNL